jgi:hypothetical protein
MKNFKELRTELSETILLGKSIQMGDRRGRIVGVVSVGGTSRYDTVYRVKFQDGTKVEMHDSQIRPFLAEESGAGEEATDELDDNYREETPGEEVQEARKDVYAIVDKKGKVVAANLTKQNAHKEISRHRDGTIILDPDAKTGDVLKYFAKESVEESAPTNSVGGGMSPHFGGEGSIQGTDSHLGKKKKKRKQFAGAEVFEMSSDDYHTCMHGRKRYERWNKRLNMENIDNQEIRAYAHKNPGLPIVIQDKTTGIMAYLIHGNKK